jgi:hypothetical protein
MEMGINMQYGDLDNVGVIMEDLNPFLLKRIQQTTKTFKDKFVGNTSSDMLVQFHRRVDGYDEDHSIPADLKEDITKEILRLIDLHEDRYGYFSRIFNFVTELAPGKIQFELERLWVNIQRKGEFLPIHTHTGIYSFVIWTDVPFNIEDEYKSTPNPTTDKGRAGYFQFLYTDALGKITTLNLPVDKRWEGRICLFPAELNHQVYPFYSSNDVRVSISGNVRVRPHAKF